MFRLRFNYDIHRETHLHHNREIKLNRFHHRIESKLFFMVRFLIFLFLLEQLYKDRHQNWKTFVLKIYKLKQEVYVI